MKNGKKSPYKEEIYTTIPTTHLIVFGVYLISRNNGKCTFEKLIEECFRLFPKVFSFSRHPEWPDSLKFDRTLRKLREKGLVVGNANTLFSLTKFGERIAKDAFRDLKTGLSKSKRVVAEKPKRDAEINWVLALKKNEAFQRFLKEGNTFTITEMEIRNLLHCTLETPLRILKQNLSYSVNLAKEFKEKDLYEFLELCQNKLKIK